MKPDHIVFTPDISEAKQSQISLRERIGWLTPSDDGEEVGAASPALTPLASTSAQPVVVYFRETRPTAQSNDADCSYASSETASEVTHFSRASSTSSVPTVAPSIPPIPIFFSSPGLRNPIELRAYVYNALPRLLVHAKNKRVAIAAIQSIFDLGLFRAPKGFGSWVQQPVPLDTLFYSMPPVTTKAGKVRRACLDTEVLRAVLWKTPSHRGLIHIFQAGGIEMVIANVEQLLGAKHFGKVDLAQAQEFASKHKRDRRHMYNGFSEGFRDGIYMHTGSRVHPRSSCYYPSSSSTTPRSNSGHASSSGPASTRSSRGLAGSYRCLSSVSVSMSEDGESEYSLTPPLGGVIHKSWQSMVELHGGTGGGTIASSEGGCSTPQALDALPAPMVRKLVL